MSNIRDRILASVSPKPHSINVPESEGIPAWGEVFVRTLTVGEIMEQMEDSKDGQNQAALARAFCRVFVDENGLPVFDPRVPDDIRAVLTLPWSHVRFVLEQANRHNGLGDADDAKAAAKKG